MNTFEKIDNKVNPYSTILLLLLIFCFIFLTSFLPANWQQIVGQIFFSFIFFISIFALNKGKRMLWIGAIIAFIALWTSYLVYLEALFYLSLIVNILFFQFIVIKLIIQIAASKKTDASIIFEAINGYLMMGLMFTSWVAISMRYNPESFSFYSATTSTIDYTYFTFVTMTTLGYGDVTPQLPYSRSLAVLISTAGQIYVAVIIAMLVGKYAAGAAGNRSE